MWARIIECMLGIWLLLSPFIFRHAPAARAQWVNDFATGGVVILLSLASYWRPTVWAHWLLLFLGCWLVGFGRFWTPSTLNPGFQNNILVGLVLLMVAVVPNEASQPPRMWFSQLNIRQ
jgi:SPW repeat